VVSLFATSASIPSFRLSTNKVYFLIPLAYILQAAQAILRDFDKFSIIYFDCLKHISHFNLSGTDSGAAGLLVTAGLCASATL
jgi:hypothetical protein